MIVCPNCNHQNLDGASHCEACYTPLPATSACPNCGAIVQSDAHFCGQCGCNLRAANKAEVEVPAISSAAEVPVNLESAIGLDAPKLTPPDPLITPDPLLASSSTTTSSAGPRPGEPRLSSAIGLPTPPTVPPPPLSPAAVAQGTKTQLQQSIARLFHIRTETLLELPQNLTVIHLGKPNDRVPPDIDVSGFPDSDIVSRIHADIRVEGDIFYIEDTGSSNGTYINNSPLPTGNRHRLRTGDRISLGKGDRVTFLFQLA